MAEIVAGIGVPHTPVFPAQVAKKGPDCEEARLYGEIEAHLSEAKADAILLFSNDHFNTFFLDNFPLFAIGVAPATSGPNDQTPMPAYDVPMHEPLAAHLRRSGVLAGFDIALTQEFTLDHAFMVPWHFINARLRIPIVPFFIDGFSNPLPTAQRAWDLGTMLRKAIQAYPGKERVVAIGSGSFSLEIGGPLADKGERSGTPDKVWAGQIQKRMEAGEYPQLIAEATGERMARAGNAAGELLNWLAMIATCGGGKPLYMKPQVDHGHAFGVWRAP
jgi:protocatechuate 4,5-dioxygenase beta chain